jgi:hypothetical protein
MQIMCPSFFLGALSQSPKARTRFSSPYFFAKIMIITEILKLKRKNLSRTKSKKDKEQRTRYKEQRTKHKGLRMKRK